MKLAPLLLASILVGAPLPMAGAQQAPPDQAAIDAYRRGDFETARSLWLGVLEDGEGAAPRLSAQERGRILYDLGNAAYRAGDVLEAVGWYTASLRERPRDGDAWKNLEHARATAKLEPADRGDLAATLWRLVSSVSAAESEWLALGAASLWCAILVAEAFRGGRILRRLALGGSLLTLVCLAPWAYHRIHDGRDSVLVVDASGQGAEVRSEPRPDAVVIAFVAAGEEVERKDELPGWIQIELPGGTTGWIGSGSAFALRYGARRL